MAPKPDVTPNGPEVVDRSGFGSSFSYAYERTHQHFHFSSAARYELQPQGGAARVSDKVGFCLLDSYGKPGLFGYGVRGAAGETWCGFNDPDQATVRMGLSPGGADIYSAQDERQWVDITGLAPGPAVVRARANPLHCALESDESNNETSAGRQIPGVRVADVTGSASVVLAGTVVAPEVPARRSGDCDPGNRRGRATSGLRPRDRCASASCGSPRAARWCWRRGRTGCTPSRPTPALLARTPSSTSPRMRAG